MRFTDHNCFPFYKSELYFQNKITRSPRRLVVLTRYAILVYLYCCLFIQMFTHSKLWEQYGPAHKPIRPSTNKARRGGCIQEKDSLSPNYIKKRMRHQQIIFTLPTRSLAVPTGFRILTQSIRRYKTQSFHTFTRLLFTHL